MHCVSLVVGSFRPQRFDVLRRQRVDGSVSTAVRHLSTYVWFCEEVVATVTVTFLMSSAQLQALISPFPALRRCESVDRRQKTGPSWAEPEQTLKQGRNKRHMLRGR